MLLKLDCWFKTIWRSMISFFKTGNITPIMGCVYTDHEVHRNCIVIVGKCEHCDGVDISWQKEGSIADKRLIEYYNTADSDNIRNIEADRPLTIKEACQLTIQRREIFKKKQEAFRQKEAERFREENREEK